MSVEQNNTTEAKESNLGIFVSARHHAHFKRYCKENRRHIKEQAEIEIEKICGPLPTDTSPDTAWSPPENNPGQATS